MKNKIKSITVESKFDECPDLSFIGEYTDTPDTWAIVRETGEYCKKVEQRNEIVDTLNEWIYDFKENNRDPKMIQRYRLRRKKIIDSGDMEYPDKNHHDRFFKPCARGEKEGTPEYKKYGMQDFRHMELLNDDQWYFIGIIAVAEIITENGTIQRIHSPGLWGIESDCGGHYMLSVANEEIEGLKAELLSLNFSDHAVIRAIQQWNGIINHCTNTQQEIKTLNQ